MNRAVKSAVSMCLVLLLHAMATSLFAAEPAKFSDIEPFPKQLPENCGKGTAKLYDECGSQVVILNAAVDAAQLSGKTPLVVYGAEWCVWCFVFDAAIRGEHHAEFYEWEINDTNEQWALTAKQDVNAESQARALNDFVAANFVVAHLEGDVADDGAVALEQIGVLESDVKFYPFVMTLSNQGKYENHLLAYEFMEKSDGRKDRDGRDLMQFDRVRLLKKLTELRSQTIK